MRSYAIREISPRAENALLAYPPFLRGLLASRGIETEEEAERFLKPDYDAHTHDPFLMKDMEKAVARILRAIKDNERIAIWSDYDADGIPGAVVLHDFFKKLGYLNFENYIPDRHDEGFGLNMSAIETLASRGAKLLITVDCGITDGEAVARANELGMDTIITDHHLPPHSSASDGRGGLPLAHAILNPKQSDCPYPEKMLCGSGVVFKLIQGIVSRLHPELKTPTATFPVGQEKWLLDMVGIATLSDMVPLLGENRVFARYGLTVLRKSPRKGLGELLSLLRINRRELNEDDVGFSITPRINAASRMGVPMDAFRLFATDDDSEAGILARHLNKINDERKGKVASLVKEVRRIVKERHAHDAPRVVVAGNPNWRPALLGLVANALAEDYRKPVFVWGREGSAELKGSCRSDGSTDLSLLMQEARAVFSDFGGHKEAGGFSIALEKVHLLEKELERAYEKVRTAPAEPAPHHAVDARLSLEEVNWDVWRDIAKLAPFGVGNPKPLFLFEGVPVCSIELFGKERKHLKLIFERQNGEKIPAVKFFASPDDFGGIAPRQTVSILAHLERSVFRDTPELRLRIVDVV
ncbi:MAG: single-stranded-DNA-specific exonuclease [Parcubacteria group bacterium Greene0416_79]|nr:MAG: single-stranded-DNA-specific exonuclease [Parcubacteria group bacterium Greene0416_79]